MVTVERAIETANYARRRLKARREQFADDRDKCHRTVVELKKKYYNAMARIAVYKRSIQIARFQQKA